MKLMVVASLLLGLPAMDKAQTHVMPSSIFNTRACLGVVTCDPETGQCYEVPASAGNPVAFTASRYDQSGGHFHSGGPVPIFGGPNPSFTDGTRRAE